jgi:hypothetical protein
MQSIMSMENARDRARAVKKRVVRVAAARHWWIVCTCAAAAAAGAQFMQL